MVQAYALTEAQLETHLDELLESRGLRKLASQVRIGSFRLDAVALDSSDGTLVVVELKTTRWCGTLGQLLLYPRALRRALVRAGEKPAAIRSLLITTYMDLGLRDVLEDHALGESVETLVCIGSEETGLRLVRPADPEVGEVVSDQAEGPSDVGRKVIGSPIYQLRAE